MATKETTITTETEADGTEHVEEISTLTTETAADGTETVAEITTTQDDPDSPIEGHIVVTETAPDGTETVYEVTTTEPATDSDTEHESLFEEVIDAVFDSDADATTAANVQDVSSDLDVEGEFEVVTAEDGDLTIAEPDVVAADFTSDVSTGSVLAVEDTPVEIGDTVFAAAPLDTATDSSTEADAEAAEQDAHAQAATDAQQAADDFIAEGDYAAAGEARETAENEAWEAGDSSMLSAYDSSDLAQAAEKQEDAQYYEAQEAKYAQEGDYEAAREAADNAGYAMTDADSAAGGADHSGQADAEKYNMDWAIHEEKQADYNADNAAAYAAEGDFENAERYADSALDHQARADDFGDQGEHGSIMADYDPSAEVASGGTYDSTYDDVAVASVDTSYDAGVDTSAVDTSYDPGTADV